MFANKNYENDIKYTMQLNRFVFRLLGIWPYMETEPSFFEKISKILLILGCYLLLACELIPGILYLIIVEKRTRVKLKLISSVTFTILAVLKYNSLVSSQNQVKNYLMQVKDDWRNVTNASAREFMIDKARIARRLLLLCGTFMYISGLYFRTVVPLSKGKSINNQNITIRYLACPSYFIFFDGQISPAYEIMFVIQFLSGFIKYTITVAVCSLAALFTMHLCAQLKILMMLMHNLINESEEKNLDNKLAMTVEYHTKMRNFLQLAQDILEYTSLLEVIGCTISVCLLGHHIITEWEDQNVVSMFSYMVLLTSVTFNIFIFCFIGEQLSIEGEKLSLTACTLAWYRLPDTKARALILIIAMSNIPTKLKAGKFIDLSIKTFGDISLKELNMYRRLKLLGPMCNILMTVIKHIALIYQGERLKNCIRHIEEDWRKVSPTEDRRIMVDNSRIGRSLAILCGAFMYGSGFSYRTILPLSRGVIVTPQNVTIRPLPFDGYYLFIDPQKTPAYEIIFIIQLLSGFVQFSVTSGTCSLAALLVLHACGQLKILIVKMENLTQTKQLPDKNISRKLAAIIRQHVRIRSFLRGVEETLQYACLVEVVGSTFLLCVLGYYIITEWGVNGMTPIIIYTTVLLTFTFNIFILCFIGQLLTNQGTKMYITSCTLDWYRIPHKTAHGLILLIAVSSVPVKITAGKFMDLSLYSFGAIVRTSVAYLNLLRTTS
ncbi:odorant receptor 43a-like [Anoplolepis gracilipes]|uniref:odorant receptor 43a-like n=1 Tax=Anoplolepis gracilipes TaxID=354296 RepID=UPI003BA1B977